MKHVYTVFCIQIVYDRASKEKEIERVIKHIKQESDRYKKRNNRLNGNKWRGSSTNTTNTTSKLSISKMSFSKISFSRKRSTTTTTTRSSISPSGRSSIHMKRYIVHQFLPIVFKLSLLSFWCATSTVILGFVLWGIYPSLSSCIDSTINGLCVYLAFAFAKPLYTILCLPIYSMSCSKCKEMKSILDEAEEGVRNNTNNENHHHLAVQASIEMLNIK